MTLFTELALLALAVTVAITFYRLGEWFAALAEKAEAEAEHYAAITDQIEADNEARAARAGATE